MKERFNFSENLICIYTIYVSNTIGLYANTILTKEKFKIDNGIIISLSITTTLLLVYVYILHLFNPYKWKLLMIIGSSGLSAAYFNLDLSFMIRKRSYYYLNGDWFLGFVHLHTDFLFRFWRDCFRKDCVSVESVVVGDGDVVVISRMSQDSSDGSDFSFSTVDGKRNFTDLKSKRKIKEEGKEDDREKKKMRSVKRFKESEDGGYDGIYEPKEKDNENEEKEENEEKIKE